MHFIHTQSNCGTAMQFCIISSSETSLNGPSPKDVKPIWMGHLQFLKQHMNKGVGLHCTGALLTNEQRLWHYKYWTDFERIHSQKFLKQEGSCHFPHKSTSWNLLNFRRAYSLAIHWIKSNSNCCLLLLKRCYSLAIAFKSNFNCYFWSRRVFSSKSLFNLLYLIWQFCLEN